MKYKPLSNALLMLSDRPEDHTGLARIARDLASLAATMPQFRVGFLGRGSQGLRKFPWTTYSYPESAGWGESYLAGVANDFFGSDRGIVLTNWDVSRLGWMNGNGLSPSLQKAYGQGKNWDTWLYTPVDAVGPDGYSLGAESRHTLNAFSRVCASSEWGANVLKRSGRQDADWLPHGIDTNIFQPDTNARKKVGWDEGCVYVGCVMTNQSRKDYPVAFHAASLLKQKYGNKFRFWLHADALVRYWNVYALAADYGVSDCLEVTATCTDEELALRYSACDCTMLPSAGEGFGFTIAESQACGTPCVVTDYAAGQELVPEACRVRPVTFRLDTAHNIQRAVLSGHGFANAVFGQIEEKQRDPEYRAEELRESVRHLGWDRLRFTWVRWFEEGLR